MNLTCIWILHKNTTWHVGCKNELLDDWTCFEFKFCPFCGSMIEIDLTQAAIHSNQED